MSTQKEQRERMVAMAMYRFFCPYCRRWLSIYFVPTGHARVAVICFECHIEQQDIHPRKDLRKKQHLARDRVAEVLSQKMYAAWKLVYVDGLSHEDAADELSIMYRLSQSGTSIN
jgi:DNA-directed RNA polymerase specialized sigma24 family protein